MDMRASANLGRIEELVKPLEDWLWETDKKNVYTFCSPQVEQILGYRPDEIIGLTPFDLMPSDEALRIKPVFTKIAKRQEGFSLLKNRAIHKNGNPVLFETSGNPYFDDYGRFAGYRGVDRDITKRTQNELDKSTYERLLNCSRDAAVAISTTGTIIFVNDEFVSLMGYSKEELIGNSLNIINPPNIDPEENVEAGIKVVKESHSKIELFRQRRKKNGELINLLFRGSSILDDQGNPIRLVGTYTDVTEVTELRTHLSRTEIEKQNIDQHLELAHKKAYLYAKQIERTLEDTVKVASNIIELRDPYTAGHENRVADIAVAIASELGKTDEYLRGIKIAGRLHDLGKIALPADLLARPGKLSSMEFELIKSHAQAGYDVLKNIDYPWPVAEVALQHHERLDGSGYPQGLRGDEICEEARIIAVADVVEAMSSDRPYRVGKGIDKALKEIRRGKGKLYDSEIVEACLSIFEDKGYEIPKTKGFRP